MASRPQLQELLEEILGSESVYYQPPPSVQMDYPAIVYTLSGIENTFAGDEVYAQARAYELTVMDYDPDSEVAVNKGKDYSASQRKPLFFMLFACWKIMFTQIFWDTQNLALTT